MKIETILTIIYLVQAVLAVISILLSILEHCIDKRKFGTGAIFLLLLLINLIPVTGYITSVGLCVDCIENIRKSTKH